MKQTTVKPVATAKAKVTIFGSKSFDCIFGHLEHKSSIWYKVRPINSVRLMVMGVLWVFLNFNQNN